MPNSGAGPLEPLPERTTCFYQGYKYTRSWASSKKISFRCSKYRTGCKGTMEFRISSMGYMSVRPHTCRDTTIASRLEDVKEDMKAMTDSLAISDVARPARQIWHELRGLYYGFDNNNVVISLSESQVISRVHRARAIHYSGDVHGSVEIPPLSLALNEAVSFFQFHFVSANRQDVNRPNRLLGWAHPVLLNLLRYNNTTLFIDGNFRCVPRNYQQRVVYMVHDRASGHFVPVFYILSTSHTGDAPAIKPSRVICDFESALIEAVQTQFRDAIVIGCLFHLKQALRRAMKRLSIPEAECIVAMTRGVVDMLTVVNPEHVRTHGVKWARLEIQRRCAEQSIKYSKQKWQAFWEYFERTWIDGYAVEIWNVHGMANELVARTNNPLERFNRELNT
ncbi:Hypothetical protein PHPALM_20735 [Phytophthora palmivora]|uniref:FLYWCH-type domain-containing protein n=1 Tax=Phytophthora palmivora TaxID=4796 RepID=A0A2P4XE46_9STRA|nr:Hypothetical protein PHPALM_20735 [Phytophthora palmivora]